jgi:hypothetical protein
VTYETDLVSDQPVPKIQKKICLRKNNIALRASQYSPEQECSLPLFAVELPPCWAPAYSLSATLESWCVSLTPQSRMSRKTSPTASGYGSQRRRETPKKVRLLRKRASTLVKQPNATAKILCKAAVHKQQRRRPVAAHRLPLPCCTGLDAPRTPQGSAHDPEGCSNTTPHS